MFSAEELERYARHLVLPEVGGAGQQKLKRAKILVIGAGGLGAPVIEYLAAAGVGTLGIVDDDAVSLSNLQRQIIHRTGDIGRPKVDSASDMVRALNPHVAVNRFAERLTPDNAMALIGGHDLVIDGSDNFATRYLASDASFLAAKPLVTGSVGRFDGAVTTLAPHLTGPDGMPNPTYRCLFPKAPAPGAVPACAEAGILGVVTGVVGTIMALEAVKMIAGIGESLVGRLLLIDALSMRFDTMGYRRDPANPLNGDGPRYADLSHLID
ncbi:MAG: molybdopterin-synthase adenylyltransferase MoeB [Rhodobiaceae bacterium]|nr:molybdopterin-synthase adenylyltransferase MoeB [Rhodobiaceae bacterium]MCC0055359.1 molybdopterin-synthase adenylyltransferase MoeB [Rhodobiaceae bacterium]